MISLAAHIEAFLRSRPPQYPRLRFSQSGDECIRRQWYQATGAKAADVDRDGLVKMALGTAWDEWCLKGTNDWRVQVPVELKLGQLKITGTADAVYYKDDKPFAVFDLKTIGASKWEKVQKKPDDRHYLQVSSYALGLGAAYWGITYTNASTGEILEHKGVVNSYDVMESLGALEEVNFYKTKGSPPPRPFSDITEDDGTVKLARDRPPCLYQSREGDTWPCQFRQLCWGGKSE